jgi:hypothetical protein
MRHALVFGCATLRDEGASEDDEQAAGSGCDLDGLHGLHGRVVMVG